MRSNTLIMLGASAAFGTLAVILARGWISNAVETEFRAAPAVEAFAALPDAAVTRSVVIASHDIAHGEPLTRESFQLADYPEDSVPLGVFETVDELFVDPETGETITEPRVALRDIRALAPLFDDQISGPGETAALSALIRPGYVAGAVSVDQETGVGGFVVPGDLVDVMHVYQPDFENKPELFASTVLLQAVRVLGVDQNARRTDEAAVARTVTLELDRRDLQVLALAQETGTLSLGLRGTGETELIVAADQRSDRLRRAARTSLPKTPVRRKAKPAPKPTDDRAAVKIVRGDAVEQITVRREDAVQAAELSPDSLTLAGGR